MWLLERLLQPEKLLGIVLAVSCAHAHALGFSDLVVRSHLGTPLSASVTLSGIDAEDAGNLCPRSRLESLDGRVLSVPQSTLTRKGDSGEILIRSRESIEEPAATLSIEIGCGATVRREFAILLDPAPGESNSAPALVQREIAHRRQSQEEARTKPASAASTRAPRKEIKGSGKNALHLSLPAEANMQEELAVLAPRLKFSDTLSEPRAESDPARREAMRIDQARVVALLRGEDPYQAAESRLRQAQAGERAMVREATLARQQSAADRQALEDERRRHQSSTWIAGLALVLLALGIGLVWLRRRSAGNSHIAQASFFDSLPDAAEPASASRQEALPVQQAIAPSTAQTPFPRVAPAFPAPLSEPDPAPAIPEINPKNAAKPLEFGLVWHESNDTVASAAQTPMPEENTEIGNTVDWLSAIEPAPAAAMENVEAAARISELLLAAETWMDDHNPLRAIAMLEPACAREEQVSPAPLRYLLELYRIVGEDEKFRTTQEAFAAQFPLALTDVSASWTQEFARQRLSDYPEILADLENLRNGTGLLPYLQKLLLRREGFDLPVYREILRRIAEASEMRQERDIVDMSLGFDHG